MARFEPGNTIGRRWQPGHSGNPAGRPRIKLLREAARRLLNSADEHGRDKAELVAEHIYERAMSRERGSLDWMRLLIEIVDGKAGHHDDDGPSRSDGGTDGRATDDVNLSHPTCPETTTGENLPTWPV